MFKKMLLSLGFLAFLVPFFYVEDDVSANVDIEDEKMCPMENEEELSKIVDEQYAYYEKLMVYVGYENNQYVFDENQAINDGLSDFDKSSAENLVYFKNEEIKNGEKAVFEDAKEVGEGMIEPYAWHRYGNYCGFGNSGGTPIDTIDNTCMIHDNCYDQNGWGNCGCDSILVGLMGNHASNSSLTFTQRTVASGAAAHFASRVALGLCS